MSTRRFTLLACASLWSARAVAENPLFEHVFTADPAALVHDDMTTQTPRTTGTTSTR